MWTTLLLLACSGGAPAPMKPPPQSPPPEAAEPTSEAANPVAVVAPVEQTPPPVPAEPRLAASQILVSWRAAVHAPPRVTRDEVAAAAHAKALHARLQAGEAFEAVALAESDGAEAPRGGGLGVFLLGTMVPEVELAVAALEVGGLSAPVQSAFGWHILRRDAVVRVRVAHVLVGWSGAVQSNATRSRAEAEARIQEAAAALSAGEPIAAVASRLSDDPTARGGGDLGWLSPGQFVHDFEAAALKLEVGQTSGVVETPYGFHLIQRSE